MFIKKFFTNINYTNLCSKTYNEVIHTPAFMAGVESFGRFCVNKSSGGGLRALEFVNNSMEEVMHTNNFYDACKVLSIKVGSALAFTAAMSVAAPYVGTSSAVLSAAVLSCGDYRSSHHKFSSIKNLAESLKIIDNTSSHHTDDWTNVFMNDDMTCLGDIEPDFA